MKKKLLNTLPLFLIFLLLFSTQAMAIGTVNINTNLTNPIVKPIGNEPVKQIGSGLDQQLEDIKKRTEELNKLAESLLNNDGITLDEKITNAMKTAKGDLEVIITFKEKPNTSTLNTLKGLGINVGIQFNQLPMVAALVTAPQIEALLNSSLKDKIRSVFLNEELKYYLKESREYIGVNRAENDSDFKTWLGNTKVSGKGVTVAVIDSGIDGTHPDVQKNTIKNVKIVAGRLNTGLGEGLVPPVYVEAANTDSSSGHGTHVAGTVAGTGEMSAGEHKGVAPEANLIGLSTGEAISILWGLQAFDWALSYQHQYGIRVITNSWGSSFSWSSMDPNSPINVASKLSHDRGMVVLFASGNDGGYNTLNPYSYWPWVIGVAAGTKDGKLASFSSRGLNEDLDSSIATNRPAAPGWAYLDENKMSIFDLLHPTITAPGVDIIAARSKTVGITALAAEQDATTLPPTYAPWYTYMSGTSMATPHMAGVAALLLQANPSLSPDEVKSVLEVTASPMAKYQKFEVGAGYVNVYSALQLAFGMKDSLKEKNQVTSAMYNVSAPNNKSFAYYAQLKVGGTNGFEEGAETYKQTGSFTTGVRSCYPLVDATGKAIEFNDQVSLMKVRNVKLNNTNSLVVSTGNLFFYSDDKCSNEITSTGGETNLTPGTGKIYFNHRGSFSSATGTGGAELSKSFTFDILLSGIQLTNSSLSNEFATFGTDRFTLTNLTQSNLLNVANGYKGNDPATNSFYIDHAFRMFGIKKFVPKTGQTFSDVSRANPMFTKVESLKDAGLLTYVAKGAAVNLDSADHASHITRTDFLVELLTAAKAQTEGLALAALPEWDVKGQTVKIKKADIVDLAGLSDLQKAAWAYGLKNGWLTLCDVSAELIFDGLNSTIKYKITLGVNNHVTRHEVIKVVNEVMKVKYQ
jgi:subtilisin family serine protease